MRRVLILGNGGSGKSSLAERLGQRLQIPVHRLDAIAVDDRWRPVPEERRRAIEAAWLSEAAWVIDGNAIATLPERAALADTIVVLDPPPLTCVRRVLARRSRRRGPAVPAVHGAERLRPRYLLHILRFRTRTLPRLLDAASHGATSPVLLREDEAVERFVAGAHR